jgi:hypothetical protein
MIWGHDFGMLGFRCWSIIQKRGLMVFFAKGDK